MMLKDLRPLASKFSRSRLSLSRRLQCTSGGKVLSRSHIACNVQDEMNSSIAKRGYHTSRISRFAIKTSLDYDSDNEGSAIKPKLKRRLKDILQSNSRDNKPVTFDVNLTIKDAISHIANEKLSACIGVDSDGEVEGIFTARDIISYIHKRYPSTVHDGQEKALCDRIGEVLTKKNKIIFCSPEDSVHHCREIMFHHKIRNVPIMHEGSIIAIINSGELSDSAFSAANSGGKKSFMRNVLGRTGLPEGTRVASIGRKHELDNSVSKSNATEEQDDTLTMIPPINPLYSITLSEFALPHPFKKDNGVGANRRDYGPGELCTDITLCEDAHYAVQVKGGYTPPGIDLASHVYMIVADGVGSWRQYGVDPRLYAHKLVENAKMVIESDALQRQLINDQTNEEFGGNLFDSEPIHPLDIIVDAWTATDSEEITGSSTICVASIDTISNQLTVSNLGDSGLMVVRHMQRETVGYMAGHKPSRDVGHVGHDMGIAFLSQQQLRSFNLPYQLGHSGIPEHQGSFDRPSDATTFSIPVQAGDIVILATDGLFDNIDLDEILYEIEAWEDKWFGIKFLREEHPTDEQEAMNALAKDLVMKARDLSLDKTKDSPFAILAKDNDIMWSGGMPDDTTVLCARIYETKVE